MTAAADYALLLDGGFVIKKLQGKSGKFPKAGDVEQLCERIMQKPELQGQKLLRIYFYHAPPATGVLINPIDRSPLNLAATPIRSQHDSLLDGLQLRPNFAIRLGETVTHKWSLGSQAMKSILANPRPVAANDLVPNIEQKGVDLRVGMDIARLSLRQLVRAIVVVTGDSDLIPAFKFARREGIRVYLETMGHSVR